jgi:hypothetical protein
MYNYKEHIVSLSLNFIIYLIILSIIALNNPFSYYAIAQDGSKRDDEADTEDQSGDELDDICARYECPADMETTDLKPAPPDAPPDDLNDDVATTQAETPQDKFQHNAEAIADELIGLSSAEIMEYPLTDLTADDLKLVFRYITPPSQLARVLLNIPQEDLMTIRNMITPFDFTEIINRLDEVDRIQVENRLSLITTTMP